MDKIENSEKTLYDLLMILCDMLLSENTECHAKIICQFIRTIELQGKPIKPFIKIILKHKHFRSTLANTFRNTSHASHRKILEVMEEMWPEDIEMVKYLQHTADIISLEGTHTDSTPTSLGN